MAASDATQCHGKSLSVTAPIEIHSPVRPMSSYIVRLQQGRARLLESSSHMSDLLFDRNITYEKLRTWLWAIAITLHVPEPWLMAACADGSSGVERSAAARLPSSAPRRRLRKYPRAVTNCIVCLFQSEFMKETDKQEVDVLASCHGMASTFTHTFISPFRSQMIRLICCEPSYF